MAVVLLLDPQPGERIIDLAAAPGGKATHIAARMAGRGTLFANDVHPKRVWDLAGNLERWGVRNAVVLNEEVEHLADQMTGSFDRVLLDAPCSGEGLFRKNPAARAEWSPALVEGCARRQAALLAQAARLVRPGGVLVYSTCTFAPEEDEGAISRFLTDDADFEPVMTAQLPGFTPGRPEWVTNGAPDALRRTIRLWPHIGPGEGHFIAVLRRTGEPAFADAEKAGRTRDAADAPAYRTAAAYYRDFCNEHLTVAPGADQLRLERTYLYAIPEASPRIEEVRAVHPGWWLGVTKTERFEPSHALALALIAGRGSAIGGPYARGSPLAGVFARRGVSRLQALRLDIGDGRWLSARVGQACRGHAEKPLSKRTTSPMNNSAVVKRSSNPLEGLVLIRGAGDLASGVATRLHRSGFPVAMTELPHPLMVRRAVCFGEAVYSGQTQVETVYARLAPSVAAALELIAQGIIPILVDPGVGCRTALAPRVMIDGIMAKRNTGTQISDAPLVIALGPGFIAGVDCHAVIETNRGHRLGRVIWEGPAEADTQIPAEIGGKKEERVLRAPVVGVLHAHAQIGDQLDAGDLIATVGAAPVYAAFAGVLRGLIHDGLMVTEGFKIGDLDARATVEHCFTISDKSLAVAGGVLEAILSSHLGRAQ